MDVRWRFAKRSDTEPGLVSIKTVDCDRRHLPIVCPWPLGLLRGQEEQLLFSFSQILVPVSNRRRRRRSGAWGFALGRFFPSVVCVGGLQAQDGGEGSISSVTPPFHSEALEAAAPFDAVPYRNRL